MPKVGQKGIAHVAVLIILVIGLLGGLYLVQNPTVFNPKASELPTCNPNLTAAGTVDHLFISKSAPVDINLSWASTGDADGKLLAGGNWGPGEVLKGGSTTVSPQSNGIYRYILDCNDPNDSDDAFDAVIVAVGTNPQPAPGCVFNKGDSNKDGLVTLADFSAWRAQFENTSLPKTADFNCDGWVSKLDFTIWRNAFREANSNLANPTTVPSETVCAQVITPAKNNTTNECRDFPTPCDVPAGWTKVDSCNNESITNPITSTCKISSFTAEGKEDLVISTPREVELTYSSSGATKLKASGHWGPGEVDGNGSTKVSPQSNDIFTYKLSCLDGSDPHEVHVFVGNISLPTPPPGDDCGYFGLLKHCPGLPECIPFYQNCPLDTVPASDTVPIATVTEQNSCSFSGLTNGQTVSGYTQFSVAAKKSNPSNYLTVWVLDTKLGSFKVGSTQTDSLNVGLNTSALYNNGSGRVECRIQSGIDSGILSTNKLEFSVKN